MKKSKLLFLTPCLAVATVAPVVACSNSQTNSIVDAIFGPLSLEEETINDFTAKLKELSQEELNNELIYDLFTHATFLVGAEPEYIQPLYKDGTMIIESKINKMSLSFNEENELLATFLGYVNFLFVKDYQDETFSIKAGNYFMITYDIIDLPVVIDNDTCSFEYAFDTDLLALGFIKLNTTDVQGLMPIDSIDTSANKNFVPTNSKNWVKAD